MTLENRPIAKIFGRTNLYRDPRNPLDADHPEHEFSMLEQRASDILRRLTNSASSQKFALSRQELATLRKFIFLMHFRNDAISSTYFKETDPANAPLADWISHYKKKRGFKTEHDVWLDALSYYLKTPHHAIIATGERLRERYGNHQIDEMLRKRLDPDLEEGWYAIDYEHLANYFFLGVWEAAEGTEFVLGSNAFGLWEGLIYGSRGAHRLYVVSPRIAIVLRRTFLRVPIFKDPSALYSSLADVVISPPKTKYANAELVASLQDEDEHIRKAILNAYRCSPEAEADQFTFTITKLTKAETYAVNEVIMMNANLHPEGYLTFCSREAMLETVRAYMSSHNTFLGGKRSLFGPLLRALSSPPDGVASPSLSSLDSPWKVTTDGDADIQLQMLLKFTVTNGVSFPSPYNRAYLIYHMATDLLSLSNPVSSKIREIRCNGISKLVALLDPPLPGISDMRPRVQSPRPTVLHQDGVGKRELVPSLSNEESEIFFATVGHQVDQLEVGRQSHDVLANIIYEASIIGITYWLANQRPDVLYDLTYPFLNVVG
ncbi:hypothetical protein D9613_007315 [Agrocybe pediades]|uniref:Uncharacterized protein n=1 Tax=Agrocybe pediades TaxID=84607 RepID=A0A8H4QGG6_9AGAR|nr:hypothetical protein D9613_007315 [Agrocybe pediades]